MQPQIACTRESPIARVPSNLLNAVATLENSLLDHPFLRRCADGTISMPELGRFLVQQGKYSSYFTRYLCAAISQLHESNDVLCLAGNLAEELGLGREKRIPHSRLYTDMLHTLCVNTDVRATPETENLIDTMFMLCRQPGGVAGLGALYLGAEAIVPAMYERILKGFGFHHVSEDALEFFSIHVECDDDHADSMHAILARMVEEQPSYEVVALNAGEIAINARLRFFDGLMGGD